MTFRAVFIGLVGAVFVATAGYFVDHVAHLNRFVSGQFPIVIYGPLVLIVLFVGPLAGRVRRRWPLRPGEMALIIVAVLVACSIPSNGLLRYFTRCLVMPVHFNQTEPSWRKDGLLSDLPAVMVANHGRYDERLTVDFIRGLGKEGQPIGLSQIPWPQWAETLAFWGTVIFLFAVASICLAVIVHPQWSKRERLRYPIAEFANTILGSAGRAPPCSAGGSRGPGVSGPVHRRRWFWIGLAVLGGYHVVNGLHAWWPESMIRIPLSFDFGPILQKFPWLHQGWGGWRIAHPIFYPTAVALAYFLAKDITFSVGISQPLATVLGAGLLHWGVIRAGGNFITGKPFQWQRAGSCLALAVMLLYFGRHYYRRVLQRAVTGRGAARDVEAYAVGACRILLLCLAALVGILVAVGLEWHLAVAFVLLTMLAYLATARITAEFGIFYVQIIWYPVAVLLGLCGAAALGPAGFVTLAVLSTIFVAQPEECVMAFIVQGLKISEGQRLPTGKTGWVAASAFALALAAAIPFALWVDYNYGGCRAMWWDSHGQPKLPFTSLQRAKIQLRLAGELEESESMTPWQRIGSLRPDRTFLWSAGLGFAAVMLTYALRLRWSWWPIHPVLFLIWETWASAVFFHSFLLAWAIQLVIARMGTPATHRAAKDFMIGVIAGETMGAMLWMGVGGIYHGLTALNPPYYNVFPY